MADGNQSNTGMIVATVAIIAILGIAFMLFTRQDGSVGTPDNDTGAVGDVVDSIDGDSVDE
jgi:hypothetical protein